MGSLWDIFNTTMAFPPATSNEATPYAQAISFQPLAKTLPPGWSPDLIAQYQQVWNAPQTSAYWYPQQTYPTYSYFQIASPNGYESNFADDTYVIRVTQAWNNQNAWSGQVFIFWGQDAQRNPQLQYTYLEYDPSGAVQKQDSTQSGGSIAGAGVIPGQWPNGGPSVPLFSDLPITWMLVAVNSALFGTGYQKQWIPMAAIQGFVENSQMIYYATGLKILTSHGDSGFFYPGGDTKLHIVDGGTLSTDTPPGWDQYVNTYVQSSFFIGSDTQPSIYDWQTQLNASVGYLGWGDSYPYIYNGGSANPSQYVPLNYQNIAEPILVPANPSPTAQAPVLITDSLPIINYVQGHYVVGPAVWGAGPITNITGTAADIVVTGLDATYEMYAPDTFGNWNDLGPGSVQVYADATGAAWATGGGAGGWYNNGGFFVPGWYGLYPQPYPLYSQYPLVSYSLHPNLVADDWGAYNVSGGGTVDLGTVMEQADATISPGLGVSGAWVPNGCSIVLPSMTLHTVTTYPEWPYAGYMTPNIGNWSRNYTEATLSGSGINLVVKWTPQ